MLKDGLQQQMCFSDAAVGAARLLPRGVISASVLMLGKRHKQCHVNYNNRAGGWWD